MIADYLIPYSVIILSALVLLVLFVMPKTYFRVNRYLIISILIFFSYFLYNFIVRVKIIFDVPHLYRAIIPFYLLAGPFAFFYVRSVLRDNAQLSKKDLLHFLPCLLQLIEMLPFYMESAAQKIDRINIFFTPGIGDVANEGLLSLQQHNMITSLSIITYGIIIWRTVHYFRKNNPDVDSGPFKNWFQWIRLYYLFMTIPISVVFTLIVINFIHPISNIYTINYFITCIFFAAALGALFFYPSVLYGVPKWEKSGVNNNSLDFSKRKEIITTENRVLVLTEAALKNPGKQTGITDEKLKKIGSEIDKFLNDKQPFLKPGYSLAEFAAELQYSTHLVSAVINSYHKLRFNDLINHCRVQYVIDNINNKNWQNLTLEAIALESGFSTRATFIAAFKKKTGKTPSQFFSHKKI